MEAIILAGGFGQRLRSLVSHLPKPMADINGVPFLFYLLQYLGKYKVGKYVLSIGYKGKFIKQYFGSSFNGVKIEYSEEESPLGTGGAIKKALRFVKSKNILILNGDTLFKVNINLLMNTHLLFNSRITIALKKMKKFKRYGSACIEGNRIIKFEEKKYKEYGYINGGVYIINNDIFNGFEAPERFSFEKDFLEKNVEKLEIVPFISNSYFIDIGIPTDYFKACEDLK